MHELLKVSVRFVRKVRKKARKDNALRDLQGLLDKPACAQEIQEDKLSLFLSYFAQVQSHSGSFFDLPQRHTHFVTLPFLISRGIGTPFSMPTHPIAFQPIFLACSRQSRTRSLFPSHALQTLFPLHSLPP